MILGIHGLIRDGFSRALEQFSQAGCSALQILPYRRHRETDSAERMNFRDAWPERGVTRLVAHSRYVPNLASSDGALRGRSRELLALELKFAAEIGASAYVIHLGAYSPGSCPQEAISLAVRAITEAARAVPAGITIYIENVPGGGRRLGGTLEEVAEILDGLRSAKVSAGACLDTAHAWAAGYDLSSAEAMLRWLAQVNRVIGAENVRAFHLNDTRALLGSHREHHEHWGKGYLGGAGLKALLERPEYSEVLGILETPFGPGADRANVDFVRGLHRNV